MSDFSQYPLTPYVMPPVPGQSWRQARVRLPGAVLPPPPVPVAMHELAYVRHVNGAAQASPHAQQFTAFLAKEGGWGLWQQFAKQYRQQAGFVRGWLATGLMSAALGVNALHSQRAKRHYKRLRPFQADGSIVPIGKLPKDPSYPSGHASSAYAAATVLSVLWPLRAHEFEWWARQTAMSRVAAGVHFPSDVVAGARLGRRTGATFAELLV